MLHKDKEKQVKKLERKAHGSTALDAIQRYYLAMLALECDAVTRDAYRFITFRINRYTIEKLRAKVQNEEIAMCEYWLIWDKDASNKERYRKQLTVYSDFMKRTQ